MLAGYDIINPTWWLDYYIISFLGCQWATVQKIFFRKDVIIIKHIIDDGFNAELVSHAFFDGLLEIPIIDKPKEIVIPSALIPFTQMKRSDTKSEAVHFYEHDKRFSDVLTCTKELLPELSKFSAVISPDCSLYRDMPLCLQIANTYMNAQ